MESIRIHIDKRSRPLRFAFLVPPNDKESVERVFRINSCLWGGIYNAVIPFYRHLPRWWHSNNVKRSPISARAMMNEYLSAFEPDYVVLTDQSQGSVIDRRTAPLLNIDDILVDGQDQETKYGLTVAAYFHKLWREEYKYQRKEQIRSILATPGEKSWRSFVSCVFGVYPISSPHSKYTDLFAKLFDATTNSINAKSLFPCLNSLFPLSAGSFRLRIMPQGTRSNPCLFLMDAKQMIDLIDFWNLRALGWQIWPIPVQWEKDLHDECRAMIANVHKPSKYNPELLHHTVVLKSRRIEETVFNKYFHSIVDCTTKGRQVPAIMQSSYPRIWDRWARKSDHAERPNISWQEEQEEVDIVGGHTSFKFLNPDFVQSHGCSEGPGWANVISLNQSDGTGRYPTLFPENIHNCRALLKSVGGEEITTSSEGLVLRCRGIYSQEIWQFPGSEAVFQAWLKQNHFNMQISSAGKTCRQLINIIGGPLRAALFNRKEIVKMLNDIAEGLIEDDTERVDRKRPKKRYIKHEDLLGRLKKCHENSDFHTDDHLKGLLRHNVLRVGLTTECPKCEQTNWHSLEDIAEEIKCERCLSSYEFPKAYPRTESAWAYRVQGPFSTENYARGSYSVALTLRLFLQVFGIWCSNVWATGAELKRNNESLEADIIALFKKSSPFSPGPQQLMFAECKSYGRFEAKDIRRAKKLIDYFPGAAFCFATMREDLDAKEKSAIGRIASKGRKTMDGIRWRTPVIVLTATELFSDYDLSRAWKEKGGMHAKIYTRLKSIGLWDNEMEGLATLTQKLYLGLDLK